MKNITKEVSNRIEELMQKKTAELEKISKMQQDARTRIEEAELAMKQATEIMDVDAYEAAKETKRKAKTALDMYGGRYIQIQNQEYISEEESDKVIDTLLGYEKGLEAGFKASLAEPLRQLAMLLENYLEAVSETESVLTAWQQNIHANYKTAVTTYVDKQTGQRTNRSAKPVPVHGIAYKGCIEAGQLDEYLKQVKNLWSE